MSESSIRRLVALTPFIFIVHFLEEGPGFVQWFNSHVARGITPDLFWTVNYVALAITLVVAITAWVQPGPASDVATLAWFSFLFGANALLHITGAVHDGAYVPGLVTALLLYVPWYLALVRRLGRAGRLPTGVMGVIALLAATPMLIHGYLIIFRGSRLF